jgi:hypothetical protein
MWCKGLFTELKQSHQHHFQSVVYMTSCTKAGFEVLAAGVPKNFIFRDIKPYIPLKVNQHVRGRMSLLCSGSMNKLSMKSA